MMNQNVFAKNANIAASMTFTENGHPVASTTGSHLLDLYGQVGALRGQDEGRIFELFDRAVQDDKLLAAKIMFYARDARGGTGERDLGRKLYTYAAKKYPELIRLNMNLVPEFGRWDDLYSFVGTPMEDVAFGIMENQLWKDLGNCALNKPISLLAKWLKSSNASSEETKKLGKMTWKKLGFKSERDYRKIVARLRNHIDIVESKMSSNDWNEIQYDKIPSRAGTIYRKAFRKHDEERYSAYIESVKRGEKKINAAMNTPQDLVHAYYGNSGYSINPEDDTIEAMWKNLPDYVNTDENILCMVDVSGSMIGRPMEVSTGLGMYFAQHNRGDFHNLFMTFESNPQFVSLSDKLSMHDNLMNMLRAPWGGSTNLNLACETMLSFAKSHNVPKDDMPTRLIIISDMEIDKANSYVDFGSGIGYRRIHTALQIDELKQMYEMHGYSMPQVIYWNVESRHNHFHTKSDTAGVMLASGSSPRVFEAVIAMKDLEVTPYDAMIEVLNGERYSEVRVG